MRAVALLAVALLALAGCSGKSGPSTYTCLRTGQAIDLSQVPGSDEDGFDPESACPAPAPPSVVFAEAPTALQAYFPGRVSWAVSAGNYSSGHSMLTQVMWSRQPVAAEQLQGPATYSTNPPLAMYAHQDVPGRFDGKVKFEAPGTYYLRAYAQVRGDGLDDGDYWSPEVKLVVAPVAATGKATDVTRAAGPAVAGQAGALSPAAVSASLGDAIVLVNQDLVEHVFSFSGACRHADVRLAAAAGGDVRSDPIVMAVPGSCVVQTDDPQPQRATVSVAAPA